MKLNHIGFVVKDLSSTLYFFEKVLGLKPANKPFLDKVQKVNEILIPIGDTFLEVFEPISEDGPVKNFLEKRGEGLHHLCFEVDDLDKILEEIKENGGKIAQDAFVGYHNERSAFVHPRSIGGLLVEFREKKK